MAFVRPIVYVYQQFETVTIAPGTPDLNCCLVGPAYHIQDYPADKTDISVGNFVKTGKTADAACLADGSSAGQPDPGSTFVVLTDPPNHTPGGVLDADSVDLVMDDLYIDLNHGIDGTGLVADDNTFTSATGDFVNKKVAPGDRLIMTHNSHPGDDDYTIVKTVKQVVSATELKTTSTFKTAEISNDPGGVGTTNVLWRAEHQLDDEHLDESLYATVVGNEITIKTGPTGILVSYQSATWAVNYGKLYLGYRELRTDLNTVTSLSSSSAILSTVGRVDERNPLAAGAQVAFANTSSPVQIFGVTTDNLAGHQAAQDKMSTRSDIYAIVPLTDPEQGKSGADWVSIISSWKTNCVALDDPDKGKFRIVIGSYDILPTEKASAPPSLVGSTEWVGDADVDVFVDPDTSAEFVTDAVSSSHLLDVTHADGTPDILTAPNGTTLFTDGYITGGVSDAKTLLGAMGEKRLRVETAWGPASTHGTGSSGERVDYVVRSPILTEEGGTAIVNTASCTWEDNTVTRIQKAGSGAFLLAQEGDVAVITGADTGSHNDGFIIITVDASGDYIDIDLPYAADANSGSLGVKVYRPVLSVNDATWTDDHTITKTGEFTGAAIGDLAVVLANSDGTVTSRGMWVVTEVSANYIKVAYDATYKLVDPSSAIMNVALWHTQASRGNATVVTRPRLTRLRDNTASFTTTVSANELIEIPYPADTDPTEWDTATTAWPINAVVSDEVLDASLDNLEELAPKVFIEGFDADMPYRIAITLDKDSQVEELNTITSSLASHRCVMMWPNEVTVSDLENEYTGVSSHQTGQYLACAVGGMVAGLPSHQGFTFIGIGGISQIYNSNFYFSDEQLTDLRDGGWYVHVQDSETSLPYTIHEVTTDVSSYEFGELMNIKNFDYIAMYMKEILEGFLGVYNIVPETLSAISGSLTAGAEYLKLRKFPKIGAPLLSAELSLIQQTEVDQVDVYMEVDMPKVLNKIGLYLKSLSA
jgi:hypothetical protein